MQLQSAKYSCNTPKRVVAETTVRFFSTALNNSLSWGTDAKSTQNCDLDHSDVLPVLWGREGHRIIATVAEDHLAETTKTMTQSLIGNDHLYFVAS